MFALVVRGEMCLIFQLVSHEGALVYNVPVEFFDAL